MQHDEENRSLSFLVSDLAREISDLVRQEMALARAEMSEKISQATSGISSIAAGGMILLISLFFLAEALVFGIAAILQIWLEASVAAWLAPLLVGILAAAVGWALLSKGRSNLQPRNLAPQRTMESLRRDEELVRDRAR
jgi:hypothetical protein